MRKMTKLWEAGPSKEPLYIGKSKAVGAVVKGP